MAAAAAAVAAQAGGAAGETAASEGDASELTPSQVKQTLSNCGERRFESVAEAVVDGESRRARIMLCAKPTDSDEQWAETLEKAASQLAASETISAESKARLSSEFEFAIARARSGRSALTELPGVAGLPSSSAPPKRSLVKPLAPSDALVSNVPALPPPSTATTAATVAAAPTLSLLTAPRVSLRCLETGENGPGMECLEVKSNMILVFKAEENLGRPASVRFIREGDALAEVDLGALRRGQTRHLRVPAEVCRGIVRGEVRFDIVPALPKSGIADRATASRGPYDLRC